jgi:hypothetical protein
MKIPTKFTLGAIDWKVKLVEDLGDRTGNTDANKAVIFLEKNDNKQVLSQVFCHELIHALLFSSGRAEDHDEVMVDGIAHSLHQYIEEIYEE